MEKNITFKYHSDNLKSFYLHDAVVSYIICDEEYVDFYFENGITILDSGMQTKEALLRVRVNPDDINVYFSIPQKRIVSNAVRYKTKDMSLEQFSAYLDKVSKIEIVDYMTGILNSCIWRCVSLNTSKNNTYNYFEIQFNSLSKIEYDIFYN